MTWLLLAGIAGFGMIQVLRSLAIRVRNVVAVHDLNIKVATMKTARVEELMIRHGIVPDTEYEEEEEDTVPEAPDESAEESPEPQDETEIGTPPQQAAA